jgi:phage terminase small subunit
MHLYGLVRTGDRQEAIEFLRNTRRLSRTDAAKQVKKIASDLGMV